MARKKTDPLQNTVASLTTELDNVTTQMKEAYERFNYATEYELIDAYIFEIESLRARSTYLLRCIKELTGGQKRPVPHAVPVAQTLPREDAVAAAAATEGGSLCRS